MKFDIVGAEPEAEKKSWWEDGDKVASIAGTTLLLGCILAIVIILISGAVKLGMLVIGA